MHCFVIQVDERDSIITSLEHRIKDIEARALKDHESSVRDRADLVRRLGELRKQHKRDQRKLEDVLSGVCVLLSIRMHLLCNVIFGC